MEHQRRTPEHLLDVTRKMPAASRDDLWPEGSYDTLIWEGRPEIMRQSMSYRSLDGHSYNAFVPPFIAEVNYQPSKQVSALAEESSIAIARFDERYGQHLAPFSTLLLRSESAASSRIENLTASARRIGETELGSREKNNATQVVRNVRTMETALAAADEMDSASILRMHEALMSGTPDDDVAGHWRNQQVWIGTSAVSPIGASYIAPFHDRVPGLMEDLMAYARRTDVPVVIQAAITHAQFETIHPFTDGNGRTARALMHAMLKHRGIASRVTVPVSSGLLSNINGYHQALNAFRDGDAESIIVQCAEASFLAIENGTSLADDVSTITTNWREQVTARKDSAVWRVLELLGCQPVLNATTLEEKLGLDYRTGKRAMDSLESFGIVVGVNKFKQGRFWRAPAMLEALDAFAARSGRRSKI